MENLLNQARKYPVGLCVAHQHLDQFEPFTRNRDDKPLSNWSAGFQQRTMPTFKGYGLSRNFY